ncbi:PhzF family phenazine biosynthesis protein [Kineosphaera limosa]|nr:PhzF family phenazine biosynthesis protein [Kineosphaera limosa]NYD99174.1 PhzF family phenazine biosynthesis protein [Kineosphaera limosa]
MSKPFSQVDVFTDEAFRGNPVAVVHEADGLDEATMAAFARWTNLSETTFMLEPTPQGRAGGADYRLRIFTPGGELPFAGHPTLGSAWAWLQAGGVPAGERIVQECGVGLIDVRLEGDRLAFAAPELLRSGPVDDATLAQALASLGLGSCEGAAWVDNGPGWLGVLVPDAETVLGLRPDFAVMGDLKLGVIGRYPDGAPADVEVRAFVPTLGAAEDPVTGSLNAGLALWLIDSDELPEHYVASQGTALGRAGRVHIDREDGQVWVGGRSTVRIRGTLALD